MIGPKRGQSRDVQSASRSQMWRWVILLSIYWLSALVVFCAANVSSEIAAPLATLLSGCASVVYAFRVLRWRSWLLKLVVCASLIAVTATISFYSVETYRWLTWDPIGDSTDVGLSLLPSVNKALHPQVGIRFSRLSGLKVGVMTSRGVPG